MEDIVIIRSGNPDLEQNLLSSEKGGVVVATKSNFNRKNLAYGLLGLILVSGAVAGIYLLANSTIPAEAIKSASPMVSAESTVDQEIQLEAKAPIK